jgi:hypothetical protein
MITVHHSGFSCSDMQAGLRSSARGCVSRNEAADKWATDGPIVINLTSPASRGLYSSLGVLQLVEGGSGGRYARRYAPLGIPDDSALWDLRGTAATLEFL